MLDAQKRSEKNDDETLNGEANRQTELTYDEYKKRGNCIIVLAFYQKVQVGNDQEMAQSERNFHPLYKPRGGKKTKITLRYLYQENIS